MTLRTLSIGRLTWMSAAMTLVCAATSVVTGLGEAASVLGGGVFMLINLHLIRVLVSRVMGPGASPALSVFLLVLKFALGLTLVAAVFYQLPVEPMSFALGTSLLLVAAVIEASVTGDPVPPLDGPDR